MAEIWKAEESIVQSMKDLIVKHHPDLITLTDQIALLFKEKSSMVGDVEVSGKTAKASPLIGLLGETDWKFVITLCQDAWTNMTDKERLALLDHHLCACGVTQKDDGTIKCFIRIPDVSFYEGELLRNGFWRTSGNPPDPDTMKDLFGN